MECTGPEIRPGDGGVDVVYTCRDDTGGSIIPAVVVVGALVVVGGIITGIVAAVRSGNAEQKTLDGFPTPGSDRILLNRFQRGPTKHSIPSTECDSLAATAAAAQSEIDSITQQIEQIWRQGGGDTRELDREYERASERLGTAMAAFEQCRAANPMTEVWSPATGLFVEIVSRINSDIRLEVWIDGQMTHRLEAAKGGRQGVFVWEALSRVRLVFARQAGLFGIWSRVYEVADLTAVQQGEQLNFTWETEE